MVSTEDMNGLEDGGDRNKAKPGRLEVRIGVRVYEDCLGGVVVVIGGCSPEADAVQRAVETDLWRHDNKKLNGSELFGDIISADGGMLCRVKERDELENPESWARAVSGIQRRGRETNLRIWKD